MITKEECLLVLSDLKEQIKQWEWGDDYYQSGKHSREERIAWTQDRLDRVVEIVSKAEFAV